MFCYNCGQQIPAGGRFCAHCGTAVAPAAGAPPAPASAPGAPPPPAYVPPGYVPPPAPPAPPPPAGYGAPSPAVPPVVTYQVPPAGPPAVPPPPVPAAQPYPGYGYTPAPAAPPPAAYAYPPVAPAPAPGAPPTAAPTTERLIYWENAVRTKVPGRAFWNHDILITERRLIARKSGWMANLAKGMAHAAAGGIVNALAATALYSLQSGMHQVKTPKYPGPEVAIAEIDGFLGDRDGVVEFRFEQLTSWTFRRRRLIVPPTSVLVGAPGELQTELNFHKDLIPIMRQVLGARVHED